LHGRARRRKIPRYQRTGLISEISVSISHSLSEIAASEWDQLGSEDYPFTRHCFLYGLELHDCLEPFGWHPVYFQLRSATQLLAAIPCYIKTNSYGELVFDHAWANAYQRSGLDYYPKLVSAIPYTPATGDRFLISRSIAVDDPAYNQHIALLCKAIQSFCEQQKLSSWHILFIEEQALPTLTAESLLLRNDVQFHWQNNGYRDFDHFLQQLSSRKRKNIKKERRDVVAQGLGISIVDGNQLTPADWQRIHELYAGIYYRKHGTATLTADFFEHLGKTMPERVLVALGRDQNEIIAASLFFRSDTHLYGRVWGCDEFHNQLHFECCYYQGIEYCIDQQLQWFDPGAQGEHKLSRGFLPTLTWSAHWLVEIQFHAAIEQFLEQERPYIKAYQSQMMAHSPFKNSSDS
jgi:predicted N-acyltransferase